MECFLRFLFAVLYLPATYLKHLFSKFVSLAVKCSVPGWQVWKAQGDDVEAQEEFLDLFQEAGVSTGLCEPPTPWPFPCQVGLRTALFSLVTTAPVFDSLCSRTSSHSFQCLINK